MQSILPKGNSHDPQNTELQGCCFISSVLSTTLSTAASSDFINMQLLTRFQRFFTGVSQRPKIRRIQRTRHFNDGNVVVKRTSPVFLHYLPFCLAPPVAWRFPEHCSLLERLYESLSCFPYLKMPLKINTLSLKNSPNNH